MVLTLELPKFPHAVMYHQTVVGPSYQGAIQDPSSPSASLLPLYDPEVGFANCLLLQYQAKLFLVSHKTLLSKLLNQVSQEMLLV